MIFPMTEVVGLLQEGVGHLMREAGLALMSLVMEEEVRHLAGERHEQHPARRAHRWGKEAGYCWWTGRRCRSRERVCAARKIARTAGQLRTVPTQWTDGTRGMGQDDARAIDAQLWRGGERLSPSLRGGKVSGERQLHRGQPGKVAGVDGASAGRVTAVRGTDRRHAVPRPADDRGPGHQHRRAQNGVGPARRSHRECRRGQ